MKNPFRDLTGADLEPIFYCNIGLAILAAGGALLYSSLGIAASVALGIVVLAALFAAAYHPVTRWIAAGLSVLLALTLGAGIGWFFTFADHPRLMPLAVVAGALFVGTLVIVPYRQVLRGS